MKIVTVTKDSGDPLTFLSTDIESVKTILELRGGTDWDTVNRRNYLNLAFVLKLKDKEDIVICGDVNKFANVCNKGGVLPSTFYKLEEQWELDKRKINLSYY